MLHLKFTESPDKEEKVARREVPLISAQLPRISFLFVFHSIYDAIG